ncbi:MULTISPECIES: VOC family protein [unclassified Haematobacter]|uniref:VOC family protein n=1 Tax=unclassified Haematobacter TaxID=2640585 RepID=UPI0025C26C1F|nr:MULTISPECIES: VOC family protein [unclassified Haematobacter]
MHGPELPATLPFYPDMREAKPARSETATVYPQLTGPEAFRYGLKDGHVCGANHIHFGMPEKAAINALHARVVAEGAVVLSAPSGLNGRVGGYGFGIVDPDLRPLRFRAGGYAHEGQPEWALPKKVSHVVLNTADMDGVRAWYERVFGFRVSDYPADQMVVLRCSLDHASIVLVRVHCPSANHIAFEVLTQNEFLRTVGRMKQKGHVPVGGPRRPSPGNTPFTCFVSPSGFMVEFTSGPQQIDEMTHAAQLWPHDVSEQINQWMTAWPSAPAQRAVMQGRPDPRSPNTSWLN